jgi:hypothetical protein
MNRFQFFENGAGAFRGLHALEASLNLADRALGGMDGMGLAATGKAAAEAHGGGLRDDLGALPELAAKDAGARYFRTTLTGTPLSIHS